MKIVDKMKDDELGLALLYNFSKGYEKPVPLELYDVVLPLLYNDTFRYEVLNHISLLECIQSCTLKQSTFKQDVYNNIEIYKGMTSKALGVAMIQQFMRFNIVDTCMCSFILPSTILELNEAIHLGNLMKDLTLNDVVDMLKVEKKIVILQSATVGKDVDLSKFDTLGKVTYYDVTNQDEVRDRIQDANIVITNKNILNEDVLKDLNELELIALTATGTNNVDLDYCHNHNIKVCNVKDYSTDTVAQHTFALLLNLLEKNNYYDHYVKSKEYTKSPMFSHFENVFHDISSMTWGIVGLGNIGKKVALIATAMGANVQYYSTSGLNTNGPYPCVDFDTLLSTSDIITIHAPLNEKTHYLFNEEALLKMKENAYLINVGRGGIVEEKALVKVLNQGHLAGVGLDVFENEPLKEDDIIYSIQDMNKVILTPHIAWGSIESRQRCVDEVYKNVLAFLKGEERNLV